MSSLVAEHYMSFSANDGETVIHGQCSCGWTHEWVQEYDDVTSFLTHVARDVLQGHIELSQHG